MSSKRDLVTFIFFLITLFLILSLLEIRAERRQKSIFVELSFAVVFAFRHLVSAAYVTVLFTIYYAELPCPKLPPPISTLSRTAFIFFKIPRHRPFVQVREVLRRMGMEQY